MPKRLNITYYPHLSITENAIKNGVEEKNILYFIKTHNIDRRRDRKTAIIERCRAVLADNPSATKAYVQKATGISQKTLRRYWTFITTEKYHLSDINEKKAQRQSEHYRKILDNIPFDEIKKYVKENKKREKTDIFKVEVENMVSQEMGNALEIKKKKSCLPCPTVAELTREEEYDGSKYLLYPFRGLVDNRLLGNMSGGFGFKMQGVDFLNSEAAYICGLFSNNTKEHIDLQKKLIAEKNGKLVKGDIRFHNQDKARKDWNEFNVQWMLYVAWQKVKGNKDFQNLLKAIPDGATIIEDVSFKHAPKQRQDTNIFWGARNPDRKDFENKIKNIASAKDNQERVNDFVQYGIYKGCNVMGKILMICRKCLIEGTEPEIDYELLRSKDIYLLGKKINFDKH